MTITATGTSTTDASILLRHDVHGITTLTLNRPRQFNALSEELIAVLQTTLDTIAQDHTVRVVVLAGNGPAFCAGHDLKQMRAHPSKAYYQQLFAQCSHMMMTIAHLPQPVIARVHGIATAAGCQLVAQCDLAVASVSAQFAVSGINVGLFCSTPSVPLGRNVPRKQAMEMLLTGEIIDAPTAMQRGLVNRVVPAEQLDAAVMELAGKIIRHSSVAVSTGKQMFYLQLEQGLEAAYAYAAEVMACNMMTEDVAEGIAAFMQKRPPHWKGR
jgi:enoyl-CoA hydratase/carnithine racemase